MVTASLSLRTKVVLVPGLLNRKQKVHRLSLRRALLPLLLDPARALERMQDRQYKLLRR
jgi:hypothetical protein